MNTRDFELLMKEVAEIQAGKLPQLGKPGRAGYRWSAGYVADANGKCHAILMSARLYRFHHFDDNFDHSV